MAERKTYEQKREYVLAYGLRSGLRVSYRDDLGQPAVAATVMAVTHRMMVVIRFDEPAYGRSEGDEKRVEPFRLRPGHPDRWLVQKTHENGTVSFLESENAIDGMAQWTNVVGGAKRFRNVADATAVSNRAAMRGSPSSIVRADETCRPAGRGAFACDPPCHRCDTPRCCNPSHLFAGTAADNAHDRDQKGRARHGEGPRPKTRGAGNPAAKLTQRDVDCIRDMAMVGVRQRDIAARFGISQSQVGNIVRGKCWAA